MDAFKQVLKDTEEMWTLHHKQAKAEQANERLFPILVISMISIPIFLTVTGIGPTWLAFLLPAAIGLGIVVLYICTHLWQRKDKKIREDHKQHIADSLGLDLSKRPPERKDTLKANREG